MHNKPSLKSVIEYYFDEYCVYRGLEGSGKEASLQIIEESVFPCIEGDSPPESYVDINILNLKRLFERIKKESVISNKKFREEIRPLVTEAIKTYHQDNYNIDDILWGAWYISEDLEDSDEPFSGWDKTTLTKEHLRKLSPVLLDADAPGEAIAYALCIFSGLTASEAMNARYSDVLTIKLGDASFPVIHLRGTFPKKTSVTKFDLHPRMVPVPNVLTKVLMKRMEKIQETLVFPVETELALFEKALDLPIACKGSDYSTFCSMQDLSLHATKLLQAAAFPEDGAAYLMNHQLLDYVGLFTAERSLAYYIGRRTFATFAMHDEIDQRTLRYLIGHHEPDEECGEKEFATPSDEELLETKNLLDAIWADYLN